MHYMNGRHGMLIVSLVPIRFILAYIGLDIDKWKFGLFSPEACSRLENLSTYSHMFVLKLN